MTNQSEKKGLDVALHPSLLSDNLKIVKNLYRKEEGKDTSNPYLSTTPSRGKRRMILQEDDSYNKKRLKTEQFEETKLFDLEVQEMDPWDKKFYKNETYEIRDKYLVDYTALKIDEDSEDDEEENEEEEIELPSVRFIQHPKLADIENTTTQEEAAVINTDDIIIGSKEYLLLPKNERMKLRRQNRKKQRMEKYRKVATGELSKEALNNDKLSIKKIQNVLMNDKTIEDPSKFELEVKKKVEARKVEHDLLNEKRKKEALQKKQEQSDTIDNSLIECRVFEIHNLSNPKIRFQINTMAKQMKFYGCCVRLRTDIQKGKGIIMLLSYKKNLLDKFENKMKKFKEVYDDDTKNFLIVTKWTAPLSTKNDKNIKNIVNKKIWFMREFTNVQTLKKELNKHGLLKFWDL